MGVRPAGLDLATLAGYRTPRHDTTALIDRIAAHLDEHDGYVAFSGGKDSTVVLDLARRADPHVPVCFFDSGLEFPETIDHIKTLADTWRLNLHVLPARPSALEYLQATGAWDHNAPTRHDLLRGNGFHHALVTGPAAAAHADHGAGELWGIRAQEAPGRGVLLLRGLTQEITQHCPTGCCPALREGRHTHRHRQRHGGITRRTDGTVAFSPVWDWLDPEIHAHLQRNHIPVNPLYARLAQLGAPPQLQRVALMVDANGAGVGRFSWLRRGWPDLFDQLAAALPRITELT